MSNSQLLYALTTLLVVSIVEYRASRANSQSTIPGVGDRTPLLVGTNNGPALSMNYNGRAQASADATSVNNDPSRLQYGSVVVGSPTRMA